MMQQMMKAQMDHPGARGSFGKGSHVLLRQIRFPSEYNPNVDSFVMCVRKLLMGWVSST